MYEHVAEALKEPAAIAVDSGLTCLRFETMKLYSAMGAVEHLLATGQVKPGDTLIDSSSGIYAHALALACHRYGLHCHIVGSTTVDLTLRVQLEILGATLEQMPPSKNLKHDQSRRVKRIGEILQENPHYYWMRQYHDEIHYLGYRAVAEQVHAELPDRPLAIVGGVGTGASTGAVISYLRDWGRDVKAIGVQPFGSVTFGAENVHDPEMIIAGIGSSIEFQNVRHALYDRIHWVSFDYAASGAIQLLRDSGVFAGLSAGAAYLATRWEQQSDVDRHFVFLAPDTGHRYVEAAFSRHAEMAEMKDLKPAEINGIDQLSMPWSSMNWRGACVPKARGGIKREAVRGPERSLTWTR
ncbi:pyridoxal-phosphate dependent enzyme [Pseudonocardiaceae bacterium YIM PH 21723]|nr:pyridoxal-phosphate dependent enzyme [Pseudonocardiaceae bacterium YIM PH 21723]